METRKYPIVEIEDCCLAGITFARNELDQLYQETYFNWQPMALCGQFADGNVSGGYIETHYHLPVYHEMEYHIDTEIFYFVSGDVIMPFCALKDGEPDMETICFVHIPEKTQLIIAKGTAHFVPVAVGCLNAKLVVIAPKMDAPRVALPYPIQGV